MEDPEETIDKISKQDDNSSGCSEDTLISYGSSIRSSKRRTHANGSNSPRKCSFKTHAKNTYVPRKMVGSTNSISGRVAALTEKFNKIIEKDVNFLNEVKRNNGVLLSRAGHVYKIVEDKKSTVSASALAAAPTPTPVPTPDAIIVENNASSKHATANNSVKETIKIFEKLKSPTASKPSHQPNRSSFKLDLILNSNENPLEKIDEVLTPIRDDSLIAEDMHFDDETDKKILEAIDLVENKIAFLSKESDDNVDAVAAPQPVVQQQVSLNLPKPNESFLHSTKITSCVTTSITNEDDGIPIVEAVNSSLIARKPTYDDENALNNGYSPIIYKEICNTYEYIKTSSENDVAGANDGSSVAADDRERVACKDDGYEVCENKEKILQRTTTDELPPLPEPKRKTAAAQEVARELPKIPNNCDDLYDLGGEIEENIYATIKGYDGDNISVISHNGYESIGGYQKIKKSPSISTISSDLKANSLYGVSLVPMESTASIGITVPVITINDANKSAATCNGEIEINDSDDDEWIEISDPDDTTSEAKNKFVV